MGDAIDFFDLKYGVAGICILLCLHFLLKLIEIWLKTKEQKEALSDKSLQSIALETHDLAKEMKNLNNRLVQTESLFQKFNLDLRQLYAALKLMAKDDWADISDQIRKDVSI